MKFQSVPLYGGAIHTQLPKNAIDVSDIREVPDTQEVFLVEKPNKLDQSLIVDLLETVQASSLAEVIAVHLGDILDSPPAFLAPLESTQNEQVADEVHTFLVKPAPTRQETADAKLFMFVVLLRLQKVETDVLVTMNVPLECGDVDQDLFSAQAVNAVTAPESVLGQAYTVARTAALEFTVDDWGLFN